MKVPINLASQPFRRDRPMIAASIAVSLILIVLLGVLVSLALSDRAQLADVRREVNLLNRQIRSAQAQQAQYDAILRKPENAEVLERSVFLNTLLLRKGISWSRIFADLEKTIPHNVRVVNIQPSIGAQERVRLDMLVAAESPAPVIGMLKALRESPLFGAVDPQGSLQPTQAEPYFRFRVSVTYAQGL